MVEIPGQIPERRHKGENEDWMRADLDQFGTMTVDPQTDKITTKWDIPRGGATGASLYPWWHWSEVRITLDRTTQERWELEIIATVGLSRLMRRDPNDPAIAEAVAAVAAIREGLPVEKSVAGTA
jgi:hypothetical protein